MPKTFLLFVAATAVTLMMTSRSLSASGPFETVVYDPASKSYFELVEGRHNTFHGYDYDRHMGPIEGPNWAEAFEFASQRVYKGVRGRLAKVTSIETYEFLERTFHIDNDAWIGLRYWCTKRQLQWTDGQMVQPGSFQAWAPHWNEGTGCENGTPYMPIGVNPGFRWIGQGIAKRFYYYFVEYPTGRP